MISETESIDDLLSKCKERFADFLQKYCPQ